MPLVDRQTTEPGVCRICGCADELPCPGGCEWVDETQTLCSTCFVLPPDEQEVLATLWRLCRASPGCWISGAAITAHCDLGLRPELLRSLEAAELVVRERRGWMTHAAYDRWLLAEMDTQVEG